MLKELYFEYQNETTNSNLFKKLTQHLETKILSVFKTIGCSYDYKTEFVQDCHLKIFEVVCNKQFDDTATDAVIYYYFERAFLTVKRSFIKTYALYSNTVSLESTDSNGIMLIDRIADDFIEQKGALNTVYQFEIIKSLLTRDDYEFLLKFIDQENNEMRSVTEAATLLFVSKAAVSKRFKRISKLLQECFKNFE
ncbi:MAG: hypothetical protein LBR37_03615 [Erysipelotrichaceae bacterium]|jgi:predicted DNA-binding protein YlxM (UPF0122 family)|nr:hypothetical protein [Erysipelotrichaceae bacterium]